MTANPIYIAIVRNATIDTAPDASRRIHTPDLRQPDNIRAFEGPTAADRAVAWARAEFRKLVPDESGWRMASDDYCLRRIRDVTGTFTAEVRPVPVERED